MITHLHDTDSAETGWCSGCDYRFQKALDELDEIVARNPHLAGGPARCESGWTSDRCTYALDHDGEHSNELPPAESAERAREDYLNLADEASADDFIRDDFDADAIARADTYAEAYHLPKFDEPGLGFDLATALDEAARELFDNLKEQS